MAGKGVEQVRQGKAEGLQARGNCLASRRGWRGLGDGGRELSLVRTARRPGVVIQANGD